MPRREAGAAGRRPRVSQAHRAWSSSRGHPPAASHIERCRSERSRRRRRWRDDVGARRNLFPMSTNAMWGGRFSSGPAAIMEEINASIEFDKRLALEDIAGSRAHTEMLAAQEIIGREDAEAILRGLEEIGKEIAEGRFSFRRDREDIHLN